MRLTIRTGVLCTLIITALLNAAGSAGPMPDSFSYQQAAPSQLVPQKADKATLRAEVPPGTPQTFPNDPGYVRGGPLDAIGLPAAWAATTGSDKVPVATIDTGTASTPDVGPKIINGYNVVSANGDISDTSTITHGTAVSSIMAAGFNDSKGVAGICGACSLIVVKVTNNPDGKGRTSDGAAGILWAAQHGAKAVNLSRGPNNSPDFVDYVNQATAAGALVCLAAGNDGRSDTAVNPSTAASTNAIRVAGTNIDGSLYTGTAPSNHGASWVDIGAPYFGTAEDANGNPRNFSGTSYASPLVCGVAALVYSYAADHGRSLSPAELKSILTQTGTKVPGLDVACGCVVNAFAALQAVGYKTAPPLKLTVVVSGNGSVSGPDNGIDCGAGKTDCTHDVSVGTKVELQASASTGSTFIGWGGSCHGTNDTCSFTVSAGGAAVTATFSRPKVNLRLAKTGAGTVITTPPGINCSSRCLAASHAFTYGSAVILKAKPATGYIVGHWTGCMPVGKLKTICNVKKLTKATNVHVFFVKSKK